MNKSITMGGRTSRCIHVLYRYRYVHDGHESVGGWPEMRLGGGACAVLGLLCFVSHVFCVALLPFRARGNLKSQSMCFPTELHKVFTCVCVECCPIGLLGKRCADLYTVTNVFHTTARVARNHPDLPTPRPPHLLTAWPPRPPPFVAPVARATQPWPSQHIFPVRSHLSIPQSGHTSSKSSSKTLSLRLSQAL